MACGCSLLVVVAAVVRVVYQRPFLAVVAVVVAQWCGCGYLLRRCSRQRPMPSAQVLPVLQRAPEAQAVRHYLAHTSRP
jgi:hypothetical protein